MSNHPMMPAPVEGGVWRREGRPVFMGSPACETYRHLHLVTLRGSRGCMPAAHHSVREEPEAADGFPTG